jgi:hypothetical protein
MGERVHQEHAPGCPNCNPDSNVSVEVCGCLSDGYAEGLQRWADSCPCCFSDAYPEGLEAALAAANA